jgi:hypothetical protein
MHWSSMLAVVLPSLYVTDTACVGHMCTTLWLFHSRVDSLQRLGGYIYPVIVQPDHPVIVQLDHSHRVRRPGG